MSTSAFTRRRAPRHERLSRPSITGDVTAQVTAGSCVTAQPIGLHVAGPLSDDGAASVQPAAEHDEYAHLVPLQRRYAELPRDDPARQRWRDQLISGYLPVAEHIARRFAGRGEPLDDLVQVATVGLINAVDRFEPARGSNFLSFAVPTITGEVRRYFRDHGWSTRVPRRLKDLNLAIRGASAELSQQLGRAPRPSELADRLGVPVSQVIEGLQAGEAYRSSSLDEMLGCGEGTATLGEFVGALDAELALTDHRETLRPVLAELSPRDRTILVLRFFHQQTQTQIAEQVGISQMHVSRVLRHTLTYLRDRIGSE
ncbi:MAG: SigB/SigF/SigG family RNA polymerase sigma factor [Actinomycetota bacterium]|nr:SigB/SigF/SigG family RNA polymerase sigma factor [Actinomycetota bacterium]MDQ3899836.1 SigB/SigF/SigG family RNA polymerase sigma factor [Actinomycetota bacterium]